MSGLLDNEQCLARETGWHCDHVIKKDRDSFRTETKKRCCHCGRTKVEVREHGTSSWPGKTYDPNDHGPHQPRPSAPNWGTR